MLAPRAVQEGGGVDTPYPARDLATGDIRTVRCRKAWATTIEPVPRGTFAMRGGGGREGIVAEPFRRVEMARCSGFWVSSGG